MIHNLLLDGFLVPLNLLDQVLQHGEVVLLIQSQLLLLERPLTPFLLLIMIVLLLNANNSVLFWCRLVTNYSICDEDLCT